MAQLGRKNKMLSIIILLIILISSCLSGISSFQLTVKTNNGIFTSNSSENEYNLAIYCQGNYTVENKPYEGYNVFTDLNGSKC